MVIFAGAGECSCASDVLKWLEKRKFYLILREQIWLHIMVILRSGERSCASDVLNWLEEKEYFLVYGEQNGFNIWSSCGAASAPARAMFLNSYQKGIKGIILLR